jgi:hypothetical protein
MKKGLLFAFDAESRVGSIADRSHAAADTFSPQFAVRPVV